MSPANYGQTMTPQAGTATEPPLDERPEDECMAVESVGDRPTTVAEIVMDELDSAVADGWTEAGRLLASRPSRNSGGHGQ